MNENKTNINWYPGHMAKTKKQIIEDLKLIDIVIELLDARIPISSQNPNIAEITKNKKKTSVLYNFYKISLSALPIVFSGSFCYHITRKGNPL